MVVEDDDQPEGRAQPGIEAALAGERYLRILDRRDSADRAPGRAQESRRSAASWSGARWAGRAAVHAICRRPGTMHDQRRFGRHRGRFAAKSALRPLADLPVSACGASSGYDGCRTALGRTRVRRIASTAERTCLAIVLAAGEGTRMRSARPKVLHAIAGRSLLAHVLDAVRAAGGTMTAVVVGPGRRCGRGGSQARAAGRRDLRAGASGAGTAHAVLAAKAAHRARAGRRPGDLRRYAADPAADA